MKFLLHKSILIELCCFFSRINPTCSGTSPPSAREGVRRSFALLTGILRLPLAGIRTLFSGSHPTYSSNKKNPSATEGCIIVSDCPRYARSAALVRFAHRHTPFASRWHPNPFSGSHPTYSSNKNPLYKRGGYYCVRIVLATLVLRRSFTLFTGILRLPLACIRTLFSGSHPTYSSNKKSLYKRGDFFIGDALCEPIELLTVV